MTNFPPNFSIDHDGQIYTPVGIFDRVRSDGHSAIGITWSALCPKCNATFTFAAWARFRQPKRFCDACKAPGLTVKNVRNQVTKTHSDVQL